MELNTIIPRLQELVTFYGLKVIAAIVIFVVGRWVAQLLRNILEKVMRRGKVDETLISFVGHLAYILLITVIVIAALNQLGIQTTSFIALIGAAGLAVGLALQGSLANFAAGVLMIIFRPFNVGDYVEAGGTAGTIDEITVFTTHMTTPDNRVIIIPNAKITSDNIINYSAKEIRRMDLVIGVSYGDDIQKVKDVLNDVLTAESRILQDPTPMVGVLELADSSVNFAVRPWVKTGEYWPLFFDLKERIKRRFDEEGISIPFPQSDVHLYELKSEAAQ
ncbi:MAG: mechanosensitive ion channel [Deltaproteobacteria bacterium]|nr:mechanosensitive ion channel [Deltaproteobacteria bacterium]MBN2688649.1 mechanosensitive ion channel [Deltaproteobacteria bacterium]